MRLSGALKLFVEDDRGQDIIEYALLATFISIVALGVIQALGLSVSTLYDVVRSQTESAASAGSGS